MDVSWKRYLLRYLPLLILAFLLIPLRGFFASASPNNLSTSSGPSSSLSYLQTGRALYDISMLSVKEGWAVGGAFTERYDGQGHLLEAKPDHGLIWRYTAGNWSFFAQTAQPLLSLSMISSHAGWAVGYAGTLLYYDGQTWKSESSPTQTILRAVAALSESDVWAVGFGSLILHYNGTTWQVLHSPVSADLRSIFMLSAEEGWIVGEGGTLLHYQNHLWSQVRSPTTEKLNRVVLLSPNEGWAVGANGTILHYHSGTWNAVAFLADDGSLSLATATGTARPTFYDIAMNSERSGWIIGGASILSYAHEVWSSAANTLRINFPNTPPSYLLNDAVLYSLTMSSANEGWAIGQVDRSILFLHYLNGSWSPYT